MRMKQMAVAGMALAILAGCGTNTTNESIDNRGLEQIENVRNQPNRQELNDRGMHSLPNADRGFNDQNELNQRTGDRQYNDTTPDFSREFLEDGRVDQYDRGNGRNNDINRYDQGNRQSGNDLANRQGDRQNWANPNDQFDVDEKIADQITSKVDEIDGAYVLTMGENAYVACHLNQGTGRENDMSDQLEREVTHAVKESDDQINNVFVSSNPDFVDLTSNYVRDIDRGEPIEGFVDQLTEMVERIFPTRNR